MVIEPFPKRTRFFLFWGFIALFLVLVPLVLLYANGYRIKRGIGIVRTGGISITIPYNDALLLIDETPIGQSGFFNRRFYVDDLLPGSYEVRVWKDDYVPWKHTLFVEPQIVTDARAFLVPEDMALLRITGATSTSTTTRATDAETLAAYREAFKEPMATSTSIGGAYDVSGDEAIFIEKGNVYVKWMNGNAIVTSNFCRRPSQCAPEIPIEEGRETATGAAYFAGGVVYRTREGGIFIRESTILPDAVEASIHAGRGADFRILDGALIVKEGNNLYEVVGL